MREKKVVKIKIVIAGDYRQYQIWYEFHKRLKGYENCRYIDDPRRLYGYRSEDIEIIGVGEYWKNPAWESQRVQFLAYDLPKQPPIKERTKNVQF